MIFAPRLLTSQEHGAMALGHAVQGLGVNARVLVVGAHPDDEDTFLISWLSRGRHVETAYLSLTRGDGGQNLIGNELGEALGIVRTEELLSARRVDGAGQFFTRAYDFGFSKDTVDTDKHWPRDSLLGDVICIVRAFRPHVIVAVFSGTRADGHGHHQVSGLLARAAYDASNDTLRFPTAQYGRPWTVFKFYRAARFNPAADDLRFDVGEYAPLLGRSYAEIAGESRSQHKSQGFGAPQRKGPLFDYVRREATRVNESTSASSERSIFDGIDTTWSRFRPLLQDAGARAAIDSLAGAFLAANAAFGPFAPAKLLEPLARIERLRARIRGQNDDLASSLDVLDRRLSRAILLAASVELEALAEREVHAVGGQSRVVLTAYNRGSDSVALLIESGTAGPRFSSAHSLMPASVASDTIDVAVDSVAQPWWLRTPRVGAMFSQPASRVSETLLHGPVIKAAVRIPRVNLTLPVAVPVTFRSIDPVKGELRRPFGGAPAVSVTPEEQVQYVRANSNIERDVVVRLRSADEKPREVRLKLVLPKGLAADSDTRVTHLAGYDAEQSVTFRLRGRVPVGEYQIGAIAESGGVTFNTGFNVIDYDHMRRQRMYRPTITRLSAVDVRVPPSLKVAYIRGVGDNVAPALQQIGVPVTVIMAKDVSTAALDGYTTVVVGPRAYEAHPELVAANPRLLEFARKGGTLVVQYGQSEMMRTGIMPYRITLARPADRVTEEDAPVTFDAPRAKELLSPNQLSQADFADWVQERAVYMPSSFDEHYRTLFSMHDTGESPNRAAVLISQLGNGLYIYTTLSFFRQLPAGVPGAIRLFVNLLSAGTQTPAPRP